jgi:mRNA interferase MazF
MAIEPSRGEIWIATLDPTRGHEQAGKRPVLVVSTDMFNHGPANLVFILPLTRTDRRVPMHVSIDPPEGGIRMRSLILCDALRSIAKERFEPGPWGKVSPQTMSKVENRLRTLLEL